MAFENEDLEKAFEEDANAARKKRRLDPSNEFRNPHGSATMNPHHSLIERPSDAKVYIPIEGAQNLTVSDTEAKNILSGPITVLANRGKLPFAPGQLVELMPKNENSVMAKIIAVGEKKGQRFPLTVEKYTESKEGPKVSEDKKSPR